MLETAAACPPGLDAVHMYWSESETPDDSRLSLFLPRIKRSPSDPVIDVKPFIQLTLGSGSPVASQVIVTGVPVNVITWLPILTVTGWRVGSNTRTKIFDESIFGNVGTVGAEWEKINWHVLHIIRHMVTYYTPNVSRYMSQAVCHMPHVRSHTRHLFYPGNAFTLYAFRFFRFLHPGYSFTFCWIN